jgi:transcription elongation factor Elf1
MSDAPDTTICPTCNSTRIVPVLIASRHAESRIESAPCPICCRGQRPAYNPEHDELGSGEIAASAWFDGMNAGRLGEDTSTNPHAVDSHDWRDWLRGHEDAAKMQWIKVEMPDL